MRYLIERGDVFFGQVHLERVVLEGVELIVAQEAVPVDVVDAEEPSQGALEPRTELPRLQTRA